MTTCFSCFASRSSVVAMRVGLSFGITHVARLDLCDRCRLFVWAHWARRK